MATKTLAALVSPHRINSSRFFQTRLSHPPRIIAFVRSVPMQNLLHAGQAFTVTTRLETRDGAEEIIERLHGRMVRGWNDTGSRISVRFADTAEQRELRVRYFLYYVGVRWSLTYSLEDRTSDQGRGQHGFAAHDCTSSPPQPSRSGTPTSGQNKHPPSHWGATSPCHSGLPVQRFLVQ